LVKLTTVVLEVESDKAAGLVAALRARPYIKIVDLTHEERRQRKSCPCCDQKFPREITYGITGDVLEGLLAMLGGMQHSKSVIVINKTTGLDRSNLPPYELRRTVDFENNAFKRALSLGMVESFVDGSRLTYFITAQTFAFLSGVSTYEPAEVVISNGKIVSSKGSILKEDVKFKDLIKRDVCLASIKRAIKGLPTLVTEFITSGQMSLV